MQTGLLLGEVPERVEMRENGILYLVDVMHGQKTGFFLDQKQNRAAIAPLCPGARVLDCFCHNGSFALNAARYGAGGRAGRGYFRRSAGSGAGERRAQRSERALRGAQLLRSFARVVRTRGRCTIWSSSIRRRSTKSRQAVQSALRGYKEINLRGLKLTKAGRVFGDVFVFAARFHGDVSGHGQSGGAGREAARAHGGIPHAGLRSSHPARRSGNEVPEVHDSFRSCRPGRQCRRPVPLGAMETRARPTSRGRARCVSFRMGWQREQTTAGSGAGACRLRRHALGVAALPRRGKGRCQCAGLTLFAPLGQKRFRVARLILVCRGREQGVGALCPSGTVGRRAGGRGKGRGVLQFYASAKANVPPLPHALFFPAIPQGERRALPRTPLKGSIP